MLSSKRYDTETGFTLYGLRYYAPDIGRFITPDPAGFEDGPNLYTYVRNNPLTYTDLYGLSIWEFCWGAGKAILTRVVMYGVVAGTTAVCPPAGAALGYAMTTYNAYTLGMGAKNTYEYASNRYDEAGIEGIYSDTKDLVQNCPHENWGSMFGSLVSGKMIKDFKCQFKAPQEMLNQSQINLAAKTCNVSNPGLNCKPPKQVFELNRFDANARNLSSVGKNNIRTVRNWAESRGWVKYTAPGKVEEWGTYNKYEAKWDWRLKIKPEPSFRDGELEVGSNIPRISARLGEGQYINPFTNEFGTRKEMSHIPLEYEWW